PVFLGPGMTIRQFADCYEHVSVNTSACTQGSETRFVHKTEASPCVAPTLELAWVNPACMAILVSTAPLAPELVFIHQEVCSMNEKEQGKFPSFPDEHKYVYSLFFYALRIHEKCVRRILEGLHLYLNCLAGAISSGHV